MVTMMARTIDDLLAHLCNLGIEIRADGDDRLHIKAPEGTLTPALRTELAECKPEILSFLHKAQADSLSAPPEIHPAPRDQEIPLSFAQQRLWFFDQQQGGKTPVYNETRALNLAGLLDVAALEQSLTATVNRHEALRTFFPATHGLPFQKISPDMAVPLTVQDLQHLSGPEQSEEIPRRISESARQPFDLAEGPLFRAALLRLGELSHILIIMTHHIIVDNWSMKILIRDMFKFYEALSSGKSPMLPELPIQFADFACWHRKWMSGEVLETQISYWKKQLADAPPLLELPTDRPRPPVQTYRGETEYVEIDSQLTGKLRAFSEESGTTMFMTVLTGFAVLLSRYSRQEDILIGCPIANRHYAEASSAVGMFVNNLVLRIDLSGNPSFGDLSEQVRKVTWDSYRYQDLPFEKLVEVLQPERNPSYTPLMQVGLAWQEMPVEKPQVPGLMISPLKVEHRTAKFDLILYMWTEADRELAGMVEYNSDLFDALTIRRMLQHFEKLLAVMADHPNQRIRMIPLFEQEIADSLDIPVSRIERLSPLSPAQRDLYLDYMINPDSTVYSLGLSINLGAGIDRYLWEKAVSIAAGQEDMAKTRFCLYKDEPLQFTDKAAPVHFEFIDLTEPRSSDEIIAEKIKIKYDFNAPQLFSNILVKNREGGYIAMLAAPHILLDAYSGKIFFERIGNIYEMLSQGQDAEIQNTPSFYDYVGDSLNDFDSKACYQYWHERLKDIAPLGFLTGFGKEAKNISKTVSIAGEHLKEIEVYCKSNELSHAAYFKAIYGIVLNRYFDSSDDFAVYDVIEAHQQTVGCFYHILPVIFPRQMLRPDAVVADYFDHIKNYREETALFQNISVWLQRRILKEEPLRFLYNFINVSVDIFREVSAISVYDSFPENEVHFIINSGKDAVELSVRYNEKFFSDLDFLERVCSVSRQIIRGCSHFRELDILLEPERHKLLTEWNDTAVPYPDDKCVHQLFEEQAEKTPDAVAVVFEDQQLTYSELNARANQLAHYLQDMGVGPEVLIGICVERSLEMIVGLLGILKAGGAYVPLDPAYPKERLAFMLEDSHVPVLLTQDRLLERLPEYKGHIVCIDTNWQLICRKREKYFACKVKSDTLIYILYTSGSTGKPKGVMIEHRNVVALLLGFERIAHRGIQLVGTLLCSFGFDVSVWEIFSILCFGGTLHILLPEIFIYSKHFVNYLVKHSVTNIYIPPALLSGVISQLEDLNKRIVLDRVLVGVDPIKQGLLQRFRNLSERLHIINGYGPTEATICATFFNFHLAADIERRTPIGVAVYGYKLYIVDSKLNIVPIGGAGELLIGGVGLARGYLNRPELTAEKFIPNPFSKESGSRLYKTGDLARYLPDGNIEFLGRIDHQVKIRGFRIELGEIETVLTRHPAVREASVIVREDSPGDKRLTAYIVPNQEHLPLTHILYTFLKEKIPDYMIPSAFVIIDKMPLTPNGKIDRNALPPPKEISLTEAYIAPRNTLEMQLVKIWENVLNRHPVSVRDNFFQIGGHSLLAVRLLSQIQQEFGQNLPLSIFFQGPSIEHLANILRNKTDDARIWSPLVAIQLKGSKPPFFCVPGQGGNVVYLYKLTRHLHTDQPFFSFQARGLDGESEPFTRIEDMAACYIEEMQSIQPRGKPYRLGGHSFGAFVAFEMAGQLHRQGQRVDFLAILDIPAILPRNHSVKIDQDEAQWLTDIAAVIENISGKNLGIIYETLSSLDPDQQLDCLKERMERVNLLPPGAGIGQVRGIVQVIRSAELALVQYEPKADCPYPITLFRTPEPLRDKYGIFTHDPDDETWGWSRVSAEPVNIRRIPGNHGTLMDDPNVQALAEALNHELSCLNR